MTSPMISRRSFLTQPRGKPQMTRLRPPWLEDVRLEACTGCEDCATACPEGIIAMDEGHRPYVSFATTGCTFCGDCARACPEELFGDTNEPPWQAQVAVSSVCLLQTGVTCQLCTDFCDADALRFDLSIRPVGGLKIDAEACTGCGMCVGACPVAAITVEPTPRQEQAA